MRKPKVLIVEDEPDIVTLLRMNLKPAGFEVVSAHTGEAGLKVAREERPDLIILDVMLPKMDGLELCGILRRETKAPILFLTAKAAEVDRLLGFKLGADDYVAKPFSPPEVVARVQALLRRAHPGHDHAGVVTLGGLVVDLERHEVHVHGKPRELAPKEYQLLEQLVRADGRPLSREELLKRVWGYEESLEIDTRTVDQHVARLRRRLRPEGRRILTVMRLGYRLVTEP